MIINLFELLCGDVARSRYVTRFSTCRVLHPESVAEHSFFTAFYCMVISDWCADNGINDIDNAILLRRALVHDLEESMTGDLPRHFKHLTEEFNGHVEKLATRCLQDLLSKLFDDRQSCLRIMEHWVNAKNGTTEGRILAFADFLSVLSYVTEELRSANRTMKTHIIEMRAYAESFYNKEFSFLKPLVDEANRILEREVLS